MLEYWWVPRPKNKLDSVPEVLAIFAEISLNQAWEKQMNSQIALEDALESEGLKREGLRRDGRGSGGRTYGAWLRSLGLIFNQKSTGHIKLTLAGEALLAGEAPVPILREQILKYQFPSSFSIGTNVEVNRRFKIRPFRFLLRLLADNRIKYLTKDEISKIIVVKAEDESNKCYESIVNDILRFRKYGLSSLEPDFLEKYSSNRKSESLEKLFVRLDVLTCTLINWLEYTQLVVRDSETRNIEIIPDRLDEVNEILLNKPAFIDRPEEHEYFQRKYGLDPKHKKDMRNLENTATVTPQMIIEKKIQREYLKESLVRPISSITTDLIDKISITTGYDNKVVEKYLLRQFPHGSIGNFMPTYFELAFHGRGDAIKFEEVTTNLFNEVFGFESIHLGQTGSKSTPDILLYSDQEKYQAVVDNKAYSKYSITGDHHNRMVVNYLSKIDDYSNFSVPIGFFLYIAGGFASNIDKQIQSIVEESQINGAAITVSNFIKMIENQIYGNKTYSHSNLKTIFGKGKEVLLSDI